jgi:hypothetical protein
MSEIYSPPIFVNPYLPPNWSPGGGSNDQRMGNSQLGNPRNTLARMPLATADTFPTTSLRVTQVTTDVLRNTDPNVLVTRVSADVLRNVDSNVRVTSLALEVLRSTSFGADYTVSATTGLEIGLVGGKLRAVNASATTGLEIGSRASGKKVSFYLVSASTGLTLLHTTHVNKVAVASASTGILVGQRSRDAENPNILVSASTGLAIGSVGDRFANRAYFRNAETLFYMGISPSYTRNVKATATTGLQILSTGAGRNTKIFVSATTGLNLGVAPSGTVPRVYLVSATSGLKVGNRGVASNSGKYVVATTTVNLGNIVAKSKIGPVYASATTTLSLKLKAAKAMNFAIRVSARTSMDFGVGAGDSALRAYFASASTQLVIGQAGSEVRSTRSSATTALEIGARAVKVGRDIRVSATTALSMALVDGSNGFLRVSSTPSGFELLIQATASKSGTPADTGLVFTHRADAEVWLPWRRNALSLPPGGQLPH